MTSGGPFQSQPLCGSVINSKIKYCVVPYNYFRDRENQLLQTTSIVALSREIQICSYEEQQIDFTSGTWEGAPTSAISSRGERRGEKWLQKWVL